MSARFQPAYYGAVTYIVEDNQRRSPTPFNVADSEKDAMVVDCRNQLFKK